jgi:hypothetical protein
MAHMHHFLCYVRSGLKDTHHISHRIVRIGADDKVRSGQKVEVQDLIAHVGDALHQAAQFHRSRWRCNAKATIRRFTGGQVVCPGADPANVADGSGHLLYGPTFAKFLKPTQVLDMDLGINNVACVIQGDGDLTVAFDPCYWLNIDHLAHAFYLLISLVVQAAPSGCRARRCNGSSLPVDPRSI